MTNWGYYWASVIVLTALLFFPASRMVWILSVRRLERRRGERLDDTERRGQLVRARFIGAIVCFIFAMLFNYSLLDMSQMG